jgi:hypothetical protein
MSEKNRSLDEHLAAFRCRHKNDASSNCEDQEVDTPAEAYAQAATPQADPEAPRPPAPPSTALLANCYMALGQIVQKLQLSSVALYKLLLEKNLITDEEFAATLEKERILFDAECRKAQQRMGEPV